jgi:uncharacterized protein (TIGR02453 family)
MPAKPVFPGFSKQMPAFFRALEKNNDRDWFTPRKEDFEKHIRQPMIELVGLLNQDLARFAPFHVVDPPSKALYRIYRDTRFSKDKTPYKTHIAATFHRAQLPRNGAAGLYFACSHTCVEIAGGVYLSDPADFAILRRAIADRPNEFHKLVTDKKLTRAMGPIIGEKLTRLPKGYESHAGSPAAEYLKHKQLYWYVELPAKLALTAGLQKELIARFKVMTDALEWMNHALLAARVREGEEARPVRPEPMF